MKALRANAGDDYTLVSFWAIDERPTGSKDPYALRRAALGVIRIILENNLRIGIGGHVFGDFQLVADQLRMREFHKFADQVNLVQGKLNLDVVSEDGREVVAQIEERARKFRVRSHSGRTDS